MKLRFKPIISAIFLITYAATSVASDEIILDTKYYSAEGEPTNVALMLLGGSEGGMPRYDFESFTAAGFPCLAVGYFKTENTTDRLGMIPLEYFGEALRFFQSQAGMKNKKIVVYGNSKGGELALLLASIYPQVQGVIARVPSSVVFQGIRSPSSSWSLDGSPLPFVPYAPFEHSKVVNSEYIELYELSLKQSESVSKAMIKVENINGPILLLTGMEDRMWPSTQMGDAIIARLGENNFKYWNKHFAYENAGHSLNEGHMMGGNSAGNKHARLDAKQRIFDFLNMISED